MEHQITESPWRCSLKLLAEPPVETEWLIHGLIPAGSVVLFSGREGTMKTWLAMDWAHAVAEGGNWLNRPCESSAVLYLDAEMPGSLFRNRLHAVGGSLNLNVWRWQDRSFPAGLDDSRLRDAARSHRLIVVDTLRRFMRNLDENSATEMAGVTKNLRELTRHGATVIVLHHATKDLEKPSYRGSSELGAGVDVALHIIKKWIDGRETLQITTSKTRFENSPELVLRVEKIPARPLFHDMNPQPDTTNALPSSEDLDRLANVIAELEGRLGRSPTQSEIVEAAKSMGSRNTVLGRLQEGEGTRWQSELNGRSRIYKVLSTCPPVRPPRGEAGLDNSQWLTTPLAQCQLASVVPSYSTPSCMVGDRSTSSLGGSIVNGPIGEGIEWPGYPEESWHRVGSQIVACDKSAGIESDWPA